MQEYNISLPGVIERPSISYRAIFFYFLIFLLVSSTALVIVGIPENLSWAIITVLLFGDFLFNIITRKSQVNIYRAKLFAPILLILLIDKGHDFLYSYNVKDLFAILAGFLLLYKVISISKKDSHIFWMAFFHACHFSYVVLLLYFLLTGSNMKDVDQYLNYYFLMVLFYHFNMTKNKLFFLIAASVLLYLYYLILEPRFLVICFFIMSFCLIGLKKTTVTFRRRCLKAFWLLFPPVLIVVAIWLELFGSLNTSVSTEFTGRGFIWYNFILLPVTNNSILFGLSSAESFVNSISGSFIFNEGSYVQEYMSLIITGGNTHNGLVYIFYNAGVIGIILYYVFLWRCFRNDLVITNNWVLIIIMSIIFLLFGRSLYGVYLMGHMLLFSLVIPVRLSKKQFSRLFI